MMAQRRLGAFFAAKEGQGEAELVGTTTQSDKPCRTDVRSDSEGSKSTGLCSQGAALLGNAVAPSSAFLCPGCSPGGAASWLYEGRQFLRLQQ